MSKSPTPWTARENEMIVADYFVMLSISQTGGKLNKTRHRLTLINQMSMGGNLSRSEASIEFKHRNISQVLRDHGYANLKGYLPAENVQAALRVAVRSYLAMIGAHLNLSNTEAREIYKLEVLSK